VAVIYEHTISAQGDLLSAAVSKISNSRKGADVMKMKRSMRINAKGKQLNRFINAIHQHRIDCRGQFCRGEVFYFDIYRRDLSEVRDIAKNYGIELKTAEYDSLSARLFRYRRRL
jgi:similar to stage IV sporulation protein